MSKPKTRGNGEGSIFYNNSKKMWVAQLTIGFDDNGKQKQKSFYGKLRKDVAKKLETKLAELRNNVYVDTDSITLSKIITDFIEEKHNTNQVSDSTYVSNKYSLKIINKHAIAKKTIQKITNYEISQFLISLVDYSNSTISKIYQLLQSGYNRAVLLNILVASPFNIKGAIVCPKSNKSDKKIDALTFDEQKLLLLELKKDTSKCNKNVIYFEMFLGMRIGEVLALTINDIDLKNNLLYVKRTLTIDSKGKYILGNKTKTFSGNRIIPITKVVLPYVTSAIKDYEENPNQLLFTDDNKNVYSPNCYNTFFKQICKNANIRVTTKIIKRVKNKKEIEIKHLTSNVNQHMLRHTYATRAIESGVDPVILQHALGHKDISITLNTYTTIFEKYKKEKLECVSDYMSTLF